MLRSYLRNGANLKIGPEQQAPATVDPAAPPVWLDLFNPTPEEDRLVEQLVGVSIPTREEMQEIEVSARLYQENGAEFMTITAVTQLDTEEPVTTPITFVLKGNTLVTVRYAEPKAFANFAARAQKPNAVRLLDRRADHDGTDRSPVRPHGRRARAGRRRDRRHIARPSSARRSRTKRPRPRRTCRPSSSRSARTATCLTMVRESLVSINRVLTYHTSVEQEDKKDRPRRPRCAPRSSIAMSSP